MIEAITSVLNGLIMLAFLGCVLFWVNLGRRLSKVISEFEEISSDNSQKCDYPQGNKELDEHMD